MKKAKIIIAMIAVAAVGGATGAYQRSRRGDVSVTTETITRGDIVQVVKANGTLDSSFGRSGTVVTTLPGGAAYWSLVLQPNGKLVAAGVAGVLYVNAHPPAEERLLSSTPSAVASLAFLGTIGLLLVTVTIIARSQNYRSLRNQLLTSFIVIVTIPTLLATILAFYLTALRFSEAKIGLLLTMTLLGDIPVDRTRSGVISARLRSSFTVTASRLAKRNSTTSRL